MNESVTESEVFDLIKEEPMNVNEIAENLTEGSSICPECGGPSEKYTQKRKEVLGIVKGFVDDERIVSTPEWKYKVPKS